MKIKKLIMCGFVLLSLLLVGCNHNNIIGKQKIEISNYCYDLCGNFNLTNSNRDTQVYKKSFVCSCFSNPILKIELDSDQSEN